MSGVRQCPQTGLWSFLTSSMTSQVTRCRSVRQAKPPSTRSIFTSCHCCEKSFCACEAGRTTSSLRASRRSHTALLGSAAAKALKSPRPIAQHGKSERALTARRQHITSSNVACWPEAAVAECLLLRMRPPRIAGLWKLAALRQGHKVETGSEARRGIGSWIDYYNRRRPHSTFGGRIPDEVYATAEITERLAA